MTIFAAMRRSSFRIRSWKDAAALIVIGLVWWGIFELCRRVLHLEKQKAIIASSVVLAAIVMLLSSSGFFISV